MEVFSFAEVVERVVSWAAVAVGICKALKTGYSFAVRRLKRNWVSASCAIPRSGVPVQVFGCLACGEPYLLFGCHSTPESSLYHKVLSKIFPPIGDFHQCDEEFMRKAEELGYF